MKKEDKIGWLAAIATTLIMLIGMVLAWNPYHPFPILGFFITATGFILAVALTLGIIKFKAEEKNERLIDEPIGNH